MPLLHRAQKFVYVTANPPHRRRTSTRLACDLDDRPTPAVILPRIHTRISHSALSRHSTLHVPSDDNHLATAAPAGRTRCYAQLATAATLAFLGPYHSQCTGLWHFLQLNFGHGHRGQNHRFSHPQTPLTAIFIPPLRRDCTVELTTILRIVWVVS